MINDLILNILQFLFDIYTNTLHTPINNLITHINTWQNYTSDFTVWLGGVYYILGKPLCIFMLTAFGLILTIRIIFAIVHLIGQFVP